MVTPDMGNKLPSHGYFAIDCGMYGAVMRGEQDLFSMERYERYIKRMLANAGDRCLFVVTPDMPFSMDGTIAQFNRYGERTKSTGGRIAFVTQDGMSGEDVPWNDIDALFVGGGTEWKTGHESGSLIKEAHRRGKWVHMGRVNSYRRFRAAETMGCDSVDGTFLAFAPDQNWLRLRHWLDHPQSAMVIA